eukprot:scaffold1466_cov249-Pinguiococcus_pyrenoidosus.AAC.7
MSGLFLSCALDAKRKKLANVPVQHARGHPPIPSLVHTNHTIEELGDALSSDAGERHDGRIGCYSGWQAVREHVVDLLLEVLVGLRSMSNVKLGDGKDNRAALLNDLGGQARLENAVRLPVRAVQQQHDHLRAADRVERLKRGHSLQGV